MTHNSIPLRRKQGSIEVQVYANLLKVRRPSGSCEKPVGGPRGRIKGFSKAARKRLLELVNRVRNSIFGAVFVHLTYPAEFPKDPQLYKRDWDVFARRMKRAWPSVCGIWRLEFQKRGAPHYHVLAWGLSGDEFTLIRFRHWVAQNWYEVVASEDEKHLRAGTRVDRINNKRHAAAYASKYAAKVSEEDQFVGRHWGKFNATQLDIEMAFSVNVSYREYVRLRRMAAAFIKSKGSAYWKRLKRQQRGFAVFGLGDDSLMVPLSRMTVVLMLAAVVEEP